MPFVNIVVRYTMAPRQKVDNALRQDTTKLYKKNFTIRHISEKINHSKNVVGRIIRSYKETGYTGTPKKVGRPRKTSVREDRVIQRTSLKGRFKSSAAISREMNDSTGMNVSRQTASRRLQEIGLFARSPQKKPLVRAKTMKRRLDVANKYFLWSYEN